MMGGVLSAGRCRPADAGERRQLYTKASGGGRFRPRGRAQHLRLSRTFRLAQRTVGQLDALTETVGDTLTDALEVAVDRLYIQETGTPASRSILTPKHQRIVALALTQEYSHLGVTLEAALEQEASGHWDDDPEAVRLRGAS